MILSPIVLFVYNRPWHTQKTLNALALNSEAKDSLLYIYCDGPEIGCTGGQLETLNEVWQIVNRETRFKDINIIKRNKNIGLASSIIDGVTEVVNRHGKVIVLEDDIVTSKGFLKYMNESLILYENKDCVFHISGFMYPHNENLPETLFYNVPLCWGWATWKRAWRFFERDAVRLLKIFEEKNDWSKFNKFGGFDLERQLRKNASGELNTWFIKWHASVLLQNGYTLFPGLSLVNNIGFDNSGVNNGKTNKFYHDKLAENIKVQEIELCENQIAEKIIKKFYRKMESDIFLKLQSLLNYIKRYLISIKTIRTL